MHFRVFTLLCSCTVYNVGLYYILDNYSQTFSVCWKVELNRQQYNSRLFSFQYLLFVAFKYPNLLLIFYRYQPSQEQPENQYVLSYPSTVIPRDGLVMSGHQVSDDQNHLTEPAYQYHSRNHAYHHPRESPCNYHLIEQAYQNYSAEPAYQNPVHDPSLQHHRPAQQQLPQPVAGSIHPEPPPAAPPLGVNMDVWLNLSCSIICFWL